MSLHDIDKNGDKRGKPELNQHDALDQRPANGTNSVNYTTDNSSAAGAILSGNAQLVKKGTAQVVAPAGNPGTIISTTTTVPHNLGYTPLAMAFINNVTGAGYGIPLPIWVSFGANTGGVGGATEYLGVIRYMTFAADGTNFYVITYSSGVAIATNYTVTFYLYRQTQ